MAWPLDAGWRLSPEKLRFSRALWNAGQLLSRGEYGGYQYSEHFLRALFSQQADLSEADEIVSIFPLLPSDHSSRALVSIYIDATLLNNFEEYGVSEKVGRSIIDDALERERRAYHRAARIICRSRAAAKSVVKRYGIDARKVHVVPGGANITGDIEPAPLTPRKLSLKPIRLGFIGKDWRRKNLPFVLAIAEALHARGVSAEVLAAGFDPRTGPRHPRMKAVGFIDKSVEMRRFIEFMQSCHFTCLFSTAEAFGLSNRESLQLGVPVLARDIGGIPDTMPMGCGHLFNQAARPDDVADIIETYVRAPDHYRALRDVVIRRREEFTWITAVRKMQEIWSGSDEYSYARIASPHV